MPKTKIEWTEHSWNPLKVRTGGPFGCTKVSPGCLNCYASRMNHRFGGREFSYQERPLDFYVDEKVLQEPLRRKKPTTYFVCSMTDLFHPQVPTPLHTEIFRTIVAADWHRFLILTKRHPNRTRLTPQKYAVIGAEHVWTGVTGENQDLATDRMLEYAHWPAGKRVFMSCEPLLGQVDLGYIMVAAKVLPRWIIVGAESGPGARPMDPDWVRLLIYQCRELSIPVFVKQLCDRGRKIPFDQWPDDLKVREFAW